MTILYGIIEDNVIFSDNELFKLFLLAFDHQKKRIYYCKSLFSKILAGNQTGKVKEDSSSV